MKDVLLVTSYLNPDLDGYACAYAYAELLNKTGVDATAGVSGTVHQEARWVVDTLGLTPPRVINPEEYTSVIMVDNSTDENIDPRIMPKQIVEIIDHRIVGKTERFPNAKVQVELVGSCATLIAERFQQKKITPTKESAVLLHAAILSNTGNFQIPVTTSRDNEAAKYLHEISRLPSDFALEMFAAKSDLSGDKLLENILGDLAVHTFDKTIVAISQLEILEAEKLLKERFTEIISILKTIKEEKNAQYCFLNIMDLGRGYNCIITEDSQELLSKSIEVDFTKHIARTTSLINRKMIIPRLKSYLEIAK